MNRLMTPATTQTDRLIVSLSVDGAKLKTFAGDGLGLETEGTDWGYAIHSLFGALFRDHAPHPFDALPRNGGRRIDVTAVASAALADPKSFATRHGDPLAYAAINWGLVASRPLATDWRPGEELGFKVRACPIQRRDNEQGRHIEVDVWQAWCEERGRDDDMAPLHDDDLVDDDGPTRDDLYTVWLAQELGRHGAARVVDMQLDRFRLVTVTRRDAQRRQKRQRRPEIRMSGRLTVEDPNAFTDLLARGVGRHRSFGFGFLHLLP